MYFNEDIEAHSLNIPLPDQKALREAQPDPSYIPFAHARGSLDLWFAREALPRLPQKIQEALGELSSRLDGWTAKEATGRQSWHFDYPNQDKFWTSGPQGLLVLGGEATTDVLYKTEWADGGEALIRHLKDHPEALPYRSYAPGILFGALAGCSFTDEEEEF
jgi:hypothetical protein